MNLNGIIRSERIRKGVQLSVMLSVIAGIHQYGASNLIEAVGLAESLALLLGLIAIQLYLIVARITFDVSWSRE